MDELTAADFASFFKAVNKHEPFHWQSELAKHVIDGPGWPEGIDVPTGMGKTAILDLAVFALAVQASRPAEHRTAPTRTFMVVDRRLIVDQAHDRAMALKMALDKGADRIVRQVADALRGLSRAATALQVVRMRGGVTWSSQWLAAPDVPALVVGTVDQFGSRLLFRGYGVSTRRRPIDAALVGTDALVIFDEAHMSRPAAHTTATVHRYDAAAERPVLAGRRPRPVLVSATLPSEMPGTFVFDGDAETSPVARARLDAVKQTALVALLTNAKDPSPDVARALADVALDRSAEPGVDRVVVVCNTIRVARMVFDTIIREASQAVDGALMIGRCRELERGQIQARFDPELRASALPRPARDRPLVVVATQTVEVGADFDFDAVVSEAAPVDALLQRIGRLDRFGHRGTTRATVIYAPARHDDDPVYGEATRLTWEWLVAAAGAPEPTRAKDVAAAAQLGPAVDLGSMAVRRILGADERTRLAARTPSAPELIGPMLSSWARTEPAPSPDQPVAPFLHGMKRGVPEVLVCWRAGLPILSDPNAQKTWKSELEATPVVSSECVRVPIWEARRFLRGGAPGDVADIEGQVDDAFEDPFEESEPVPAIIVLPDGALEWAPAKLRPGTTLVVRSESGGHDEWGWTGQAGGGSVVDVADLCRRQGALRLRPELLSHLLGGAPSIWRTRAGLHDDDGVPAPERIEAVLGAIRECALDRSTEAERAENGLSAGDSAMRKASFVEVANFVGQRAGYLIERGYRRPVLVPPGWYLVQAREGLADASGDDRPESSSGGAHAPVGLARHLNDVAERASEFGIRIGLPTELVAAVELAGRGHDLGKADPRFQVMLHGDRLRAEASAELLAKSGMDPADRQAFRRALEAAKLPAGMRHEAGSSALLEQMAQMDPSLAEGVDLELVLHLIASHHGNGRPLLPPVVDDDPVDVTVRLPGHSVSATVRSDQVIIDWNAPSRFARLGRRYGWWGLALLETIVRLADIECSEGYAKDDRP